ncbi:uncharacterized protein TRAVEDRAFT_48049 [Trametes versicolor FP-101664 SS1]|uniref:uncharacterized protein n=1 Tax=Trametes versicolor (strain FP-101664) TaxID=717944 RepID=UPI000462308C|nr:uncharacterized protein TRAVEDRAFT_48049 [Trametes versicolor FP-101664 SS1]EIW58907.1 hypothetical protein TRAVEDRAFT_48049 [Trametes versicolor FP-101664 SS1]
MSSLLSSLVTSAKTHAATLLRKLSTRSPATAKHCFAAATPTSVVNMAVIWALRMALCMAVQSVLCGDALAPGAANFDDFIKALQAMGFTLNGATTAHTVVLDPPEGWNAGAGVLELVRPALVNTWYAFESAEIARALEDRYALTGDSFIKFPTALLPGVDGYMIPSGAGM